MRIYNRLLLAIINRYRSDWDNGHPQLKSEKDSEVDQCAYGMLQLKSKIISGISTNLYNKNVLEIGCGHGGISIYAAMVGAKTVIGIDVSDNALKSAKLLKLKIEDETNSRLSVQFKKMAAEKMLFNEGELDVIIADNVFEHVDNVYNVLKECSYVLKKGGKVVIPSFSTIRSKYGPHIKYGIKIPWVHIFFKERTIVEVMHKLAETDPQMYVFYPGLKNKATTFREVRAYNDLNDISNKRFTSYAKKSGFTVENMYVTRPRWAWLLMKLLPILRRTALEDILSIITTVTLVKK
jgi:2-polyprenyl-3-methyl-5-hydroxy-6-metoxy-1,4-benzoquinol methylase